MIFPAKARRRVTWRSLAQAPRCLRSIARAVGQVLLRCGRRVRDPYMGVHRISDHGRTQAWRAWPRLSPFERNGCSGMMRNRMKSAACCCACTSLCTKRR